MNDGSLEESPFDLRLRGYLSMDPNSHGYMVIMDEEEAIGPHLPSNGLPDIYRPMETLGEEEDHLAILNGREANKDFVYPRSVL